jgi:hypothetical protein
MTLFADMVELQGLRHHPSEPNTFTMATLPFAPKLCWFPGQGIKPTGFDCHYQRIKWLNDCLIERSRNLGVPVVDLSILGTRWVYSDPGSRSSELIPDYPQWRESTPRNMLHLNDGNRIKMATRINSYFAVRNYDRDI